MNQVAPYSSLVYTKTPVIAHLYVATLVRDRRRRFHVAFIAAIRLTAESRGAV